MRIVARAVDVFAVSGYKATPVADVATAAKVSPAYVFRLFEGKLGLFVAAVDDCYAQVASALVAGVDDTGTAAERLELMTQAYIELIRDRSLIALQVHAQSACDVPEIRAAVQRGLRELITSVTLTSGADAHSVQRFIAYGQLCHLIVQAEVSPIDETWAHTLSDGIRHAEPV